MVVRAAPDTGYDFGEKRAYRRTIWSTMRSAPPGPVLIMPSLEGDEIHEAEARGVRRHDIHVVDRNPAIVAHIQRRFPGVTTYGVSLKRAAERMEKKRIELAAMNLDLTGPVGVKSLDEIIPMARRGIPGAFVGITALRGREVGFDGMRRFQATVGSWWPRTVDKVWAGMRACQDSDYGRLLVLCWALSSLRGAEILRAGSYRSTAGNQTMLWSVWRVGSSKYWVDEYGKRREVLEAAVAEFRARLKLKRGLLRARRMLLRAKESGHRARRSTRIQRVLEARADRFTGADE